MDTLKISRLLYRGEREIRAGSRVAYGIIEADGSYAVVHGPTQADVDAISAALEATDLDTLAALIAAAE